MKKIIFRILFELTIILGMTFFVGMMLVYVSEQFKTINQKDINKLKTECEANKGSFLVEYNTSGKVETYECYYQNYSEMLKTIKGE